MSDGTWSDEDKGMFIEILSLRTERAKLREDNEKLQRMYNNLHRANKQMGEELELLREQVVTVESDLEEEREVNQHDYLLTQEAAAYAHGEATKLRAALKEVVDLWPYIACPCGRNHARMAEDRRARLKELVQAGGES